MSDNTKRKTAVDTDKSANRDKKGKFGKGNKAQKKLAPEFKCIRESVKTELARVTKLLTVKKSEANALLNSNDSTYLHDIMKDALKKKKNNVIEYFIDQTIGKASQATKVSVSQLPDDDLLEMVREALESIDED